MKIILKLIESTAGKNTPNTALFLPKPQTNYGKRTFSYDGAKLCNELPQNVRATYSLKQLKTEVHSLFSM